jgi:hypothetical protein
MKRRVAFTSARETLESRGRPTPVVTVAPEHGGMTGCTCTNAKVKSRDLGGVQQGSVPICI